MPRAQTINIGDKFNTIGGVLTVVCYYNSRAILVETECGNEFTVRADRLRSGKIKNIYKPSVCGVGFVGCEDKHIGVAKSYQRWNDMIKRVYSDRNDFCKTYKDCYVDKEWHDYSNFRNWYNENYIDGWQIDKDLLVYGNRTYSKDLCIFTPSSINIFFTSGSHKTAKTDLPYGVRAIKSPVNNIIRYIGAGNNKHFSTINDARDAYWHSKYSKMISLINEYPQFEGVLHRYFLTFKSDKYA